MAKEIRPLQRYNENTEQTEIFYPATTTDAIAHPTKQKSLTNVIADIETHNGAYDISAANSGTKYETLSAALAAVPENIQRGGMSIKYVQSSDNKYVQYRLTADDWSTNTEDWAIADEGVYVENPEYVYVKTDREGKILWAIKADGGIYYGAGCPEQIKDYIEEKILSLSLDEYEDIVAFLSDYLGSDTTLKAIIDGINAQIATKVDKVEGKSLIDAEYAEGVHYVENPEFANVWLDSEDKILFGVKSDGTVCFGAGVPPQVVDYIRKKIEELSLDEYEDIVTFLGNLIEGDKTLQELLNEKVDKEEGKSLIPTQYIQEVENPEFISVDVDAEGKILEAVEKDGTKLFGGDVKVLGSIDINGVNYKVISNPEWLRVVLDEEDRIICGIKTDGKFVVYVADFLDDIDAIKARLEKLYAYIVTENPEFLEVELDADDKILCGRKIDGTKFENNDVELNGNATVDGSLEVDGVVIKNIEDPENRSEITLDSEDKIVSYRKDDGTKVENVGIETNHLELTPEGMDRLQLDLKQSGFKPFVNNITDYPINIPKYGRINIITTPTEASLVNVEGYTDYSFRCLVNGTTNRPVSINGGTPSFSPDWEQIEYNADYDTWEQKPARNPDVTGYHRYADKMYHEENGSIVYDWSEDKFKHQCTVEVDFPGFLSGTFYALVSFQGNTTMFLYKKSFRITFYKASDYKKKKKFKIGDMIELSGFNTKAYYNDRTRLKEPVLYRMATLFLENRKYADQYPWNNTVGMFTGATGTVKNFPIVVYVDGEFYGLEFFGEKKDENNYMLKDDADGMFVQGQGNTTNFWRDYNITARWEDQMNDELTQSNIDAISAFLHYTNDEFSIATAEEHYSKIDWIDYIIFVQVFSLGDNLGNNVVIYSGPDKTKMYPFFYDLDNAFERPGQNIFVNNPHSFDVTFWNRLLNAWWDDIVDRYKELREAVLTIETFTKIVMSISRAINQSDYEDEISQWGKDGVDYSGATKSLIDNFNASIRYFDLYYKK